MYITNLNYSIDEKAALKAIDHAKQVFPEESCGAIINNEYVPFENKADEKEEFFIIDDEVFDSAYLAGVVEVIIHSHNNSPRASIGDQVQQKELVVPFGIINLVNNSCTHFVFFGDSIDMEPLKKRHFFYGVWDCFSLMRDYLKLQHDFDIENVPREYGWWMKNESMFESFFDRDDIDFISEPDIQPNDLLFYNLHGTRYLNHCAIMKEDGLVFHHFEGHISQVLPISYSQQFLNKIVRIRGLT